MAPGGGGRDAKGVAAGREEPMRAGPNGGGAGEGAIDRATRGVWTTLVGFGTIAGRCLGGPGAKGEADSMDVTGTPMAERKEQVLQIEEIEI